MAANERTLKPQVELPERALNLVDVTQQQQHSRPFISVVTTQRMRRQTFQLPSQVDPGEVQRRFRAGSRHLHLGRRAQVMVSRFADA